MKGKVETVLLDRAKPAHFKCEPDTGTEIARKDPAVKLLRSLLSRESRTAHECKETVFDA